MFRNFRTDHSGKRPETHGVMRLFAFALSMTACGCLALARSGEAAAEGRKSKFTRVKADMMTLAVAIEAFFVDWNEYPRATSDPKQSMDAGLAGENPGGDWTTPTFWCAMKPRADGGGTEDTATLTTPVAYLLNFPPDPFSKPAGRGYRYHKTQILPQSPKPGENAGPVLGWVVWSAGPDGDYDLDWKLYDPTAENPALAYPDSIYDPTNGVVSNGDIVRVKPEIRIEPNGQRVLINK